LLQNASFYATVRRDSITACRGNLQVFDHGNKLRQLGPIFEAILNRNPVVPVRLNPDLPPKLEEIIGKVLAKDRNLRYQHASDIRTDLQRLTRDTESGHIAARSMVAAKKGKMELWLWG
jgi:hypothetical protein